MKVSGMMDRTSFNVIHVHVFINGAAPSLSEGKEGDINIRVQNSKLAIFEL
jgi:hypothetical protein